MKHTESTIFAFVAAIVLGLLISLNISFNGGDDRATIDINKYQDAYNERNKLYNEISKLKQQNNNLNDKIEDYSKGNKKDKTIVSEMKKELRENMLQSGLEKVRGKGLKIVLKDGGESFEGEVIDDNIKILRTIHDDDMINVVNELKVAGAEAIAINGQRVVFNTEIYCGGQFLRINKVKVPAPFYVDVIGDPEKIESYITSEGSRLKNFVNRGISVETSLENEVVIPAYIGDMAIENMSLYEKK